MATDIGADDVSLRVTSHMKMFRCKPAFVRAVLFTGLLLVPILSTLAQTAVIDDAWWSFQQDSDGDGLFAGIMNGNAARLNWNPDVSDCNGTLTVREIVYAKPSASATWIPIFTNAEHAIIGCRSSDGQHLDVPLSTTPATNDYKIEIYRAGVAIPDFVRSPANDNDLGNHGEESILQDFSHSDNFSTAEFLNGSMGNVIEHNATATKEPGEPDHAGNAGGRSLWFSWTAHNNTSVTIETVGSSFDTLLAVYTGNAVNALTVVTNNDDIAGATNRQSRVQFTPVSGTTYHIAVDGFGGAAGSMTLSWYQAGNGLPDLILWGPAVSPTVITRTFTADDCESLEGCAVAGTRTLLSFTTETRNIGAGDLVMGNPATNALFHFASCHGHYHFEEFAIYDLLDANSNSVAAGHKVGFCLQDDHVWSAAANPQPKYDCNNQGIQVGWADVYPAGLPCQFIDITGVPPGDYMLRLEVNPYGLLPESDTNNNVTFIPVSIPAVGCTSVPTNDSFATPLNITGPFPFSISQFNNCASREPGEPIHAGNGGGHSLWYAWTPAMTHNALVTTKRSNFDTLLAVYTGPDFASFTLVGSSDNIDGTFSSLQSEVAFEAQAGVTYFIAVDGFNNAIGTVVLNVDPPANDDFDQPFLLTGASGSTNGTNVGASKHTYEPAHAFDVGGHSVWFNWTAPTNGPVEFNTDGSDFNTTLAIYTGNNLATNTLVAANNDDVGGMLTSRVTFQAQQGTNYQIAVDGFGGDAGNYYLNWKMDSDVGLNLLAGGHVTVNVSGVVWQRYLLLGSTNLVNWSTNHPPFTMMSAPYTVTNATVLPHEFYQSLRLP